MPPHPTANLRGRPALTPIFPLFAFTFINSMGGSIVTSNALYFLTKSGFEFTRFMDFLLGALLGVAYIAGALGAKRCLGYFARVGDGYSPRVILAVLMVWLGALCALPQVVLWLAAAGRTPVWPIWTTVLLYSLSTGMLWPVTESYVSGGRSGRDLRSVMGKFNVVWSFAGVLATIGVAPLVARHAALAVMLVGFLHVVAAGMLAWFTPAPGRHVEGEHEPHPPVYEDLLISLRFLLPLGYVMMSAIGPYLPNLAEKLGLMGDYRLLGMTWTIGALLPAVWLLARVATFGAFERWEGWHGRWSQVIGSGLVLLAGFACIVLAGTASRGVGIPLALTGLVLFGVGLASVYTAALYYVLEVGKADIDAGGSHEALIGVGYAVGPSIGLLAIGAEHMRLIRPAWFGGSILAMVGLLAVVVTAEVARRVIRRHREL